MTDPATLIADQADEIANSDTIPVLRAMEILGLWGGALVAVLDAHKPHQFFADEPTVCLGCTWDANDTETHVAYPCTTIRAITTALEAK
jgi:hypothetical protein